MSREVHVRFCESVGVRFPRATRLVIVFSSERDARRVLEVLPKRFGKYGLTLHPEKTRLVHFEKPPNSGGKEGFGPRGKFDFLGFTHFWERSRKGRWWVKRKTASSRFSQSLKRIRQWCRKNRHLPVAEQHEKLTWKLRGYYQYYGIIGNFKSLARYFGEVELVWKKWLSRRSWKSRMNFDKFHKLLERYPLPSPKIAHSKQSHAASP